MFQQSKRTLTILVTAVALVWGAFSLPALGKGPPRGGGGGNSGTGNGGGGTGSETG